MRHNAVISKSGTFLPFPSGFLQVRDKFPKKCQYIAEKALCEGFPQGKEKTFRVFGKPEDLLVLVKLISYGFLGIT